MRNATRTQQVIFAKNSDRPIFDCQPLLFQPRRTWPTSSTLQLEHLELPQAERTYAHLGSSPYWCWGYEEGINECGVVIGNEALFTKPFREAAHAYRDGEDVALGLLGMDLVRLGLERSQSALEAVELLGTLVEQYGQFGSGVPTKDHPAGGYDNSFLIADPKEAWIVETAGRRWAAHCISQGVASISNEPSIRTAWELGSPDLVDYALEQGWWAPDKQECFDFARAYVDERVPRQVSHLRAMRSRQLLAERQGQVTPQWMMRIARDHYEGTFLEGPYFDAADPDFLSLCMHVSPGGFTWGNTASSCIAVLPRAEQELPIFWWTPGPPCTGCYVPFFVHGSQLPASVSQAGTFGKRVVAPHTATEDTYSPDSYWWQFRRLLDTVKGEAVWSRPGFYVERQRVARAKLDALEASFADDVPRVVRQAMAMREPAAATMVLDDFTAACVRTVTATLVDLLHDLS
jgi:secernin